MTTQDNNNNNEQTVIYTATELLAIAQVQENAQAKRAELIAKHAQAEQLITTLKLNKSQAKSYRLDVLGIGETLAADLAELEQDEDYIAVLETLDSAPDLDLWTKHVSELSQVMALLAPVNALRKQLGKATLFVAYTGTSKSKGITRGENGSVEGTQKRAKFVRPTGNSPMRIKFGNYDILWSSTPEEHILTNAGNPTQTVTHKQGSIGVHSAFKSFVQETLGHADTNVSTPLFLQKSGYNKDNVYMLTAPDNDTAIVTQPELTPEQ